VTARAQAWDKIDMAPPPNTIQILESYWAEHPAWFGRSYGEYLHLGANQEMLRLALRKVELGSSIRVLDVACALGGNARWLAALFGCTVDAVDAFKPAILAARQLAKAQGVGELCRFHLARSEELPFTDGAFDLAVVAEDDGANDEVARVLHPGALLVGSGVAPEGLSALSGRYREAGFEVLELIDVTEYARLFYRAKEAEAKLLVAGGLMSAADLLNLQMHTVDVYETGGAAHAVLKAQRV
jgi:SAM-dependent methyltransferase